MSTLTITVSNSRQWASPFVLQQAAVSRLMYYRQEAAKYNRKKACNKRGFGGTVTSRKMKRITIHLFSGFT